LRLFRVIKGIHKHYFLLHLIVFIWGFSPVLGRYITADAWQLVWYRILSTIPLMFIYVLITKQSLVISRKLLWQLSGIGIIIMAHWLAFYAALKVSNISITMVAFSTGTLFSSIIEPIVFKRKVRAYEVIIGLIIIGAIALIFSIETQYWLGILLGILAAFLSSLFSVFNSILVTKLPAGIISFYEMCAALVGLSLFLLFNGNFTTSFFILDTDSIIGLTLLTLVCTVFPFITSVNLSKYISSYTIVLTVNLETVYGILWAILFYNENREVKPTFYLGVLIILAAIFLNSYLKGYTGRRLENKT
jgi:drug/metabolite transporter (DMT)-like permease